MDNNCSIKDLPDEIITKILVNNNPQEILNFSLTCKQFYEVVITDDYLWKMKYCELAPICMLNIVKKHYNCMWKEAFSHFCKVKNKIHSELLLMSPKFYWRFNPVSLEDVRPFFLIATDDKLNYFYVIFVLQDIVKKGNIFLDELTCSKPLYTMTIMYYSKIILRHLMHCYLAIKWVQLHTRHELTPEKVITFFLQWIDPTEMYELEDLESAIQNLVKKVENILKDSSKNQNFATSSIRSEKQVLRAISQAIYTREDFSIDYNVQISSLDIVKVIKNSHGTVFTLGAIYHTIAQRFSIDCELKAFPNHFFLHWRDKEDPGNTLYTIDLTNGELRKTRQCPFAGAGDVKSAVYCPESFLQYIYYSFMESNSHIRSCQTENAVYFMEFLGVSESSHNSYKNFFSYLLERNFTDPMLISINLKYMDNCHHRLLSSLTKLNEPAPNAYQKVEVKKNRSASLPIYPVGILCYHKVYHYTCVIRDWETDGNSIQKRLDPNLKFGKNQPFYRVLAGDQSERFTPHENLILDNAPTRHRLLEDALSKEFTHFDGFFYVPNDEKQSHYPSDKTIAEMYKERSMRNVN